LDEELVALLEGLHQPVKETARELIVLELYRRGVLSSGRAAELLGLTRDAFIQHASQSGIPYFHLSEAELQAEIRQSESL
jgi:predicted HTH domain antitoxin